MQTHFSLAQLADSATAESERILRTCVHCGLCTATCPTYLLLGDELDSPRGRIYQIKDTLENGRPATAELVTHIDRCLSCLSCMTTCPSGVHYMHLVDHARAYIEETGRRSWHDRLTRWFLAKLLPFPGRFRLALAAAAPVGWLARLVGSPGPSRSGVAKDPFRRLIAMLALAPLRPAGRSAMEGPAIFPAEGTRRKRVALLSGCAQSVVRPQINEATIRLLTRLGVEVVLPEGEGCCGALVHHLGRETEALASARRNIDAWDREITAAGLDAIVITTSGCGTVIKDYGFLLRDDAAYADKARRISALAKDVSEFLETLTLPSAEERGATVAYHAACSLQHGQQVTAAPKALLRQAGFTVRDIPEAHICCGSAGTYNILQPEIAGRLRDRKLENIAKLAPDIIAAGNIGCMTQIASGTAIPVLHTVELLDWAYGGEKPVELL